MLEDGVFRYCTSLQTLDLSGNNLTRIGNRYFTGLSRLKSLILSSNNIVSVESCAFYGLEQLVILNLSHNLIGSFRSDSFDGLVQLGCLDLWRNDLSCISAASLACMPKLKLLFLNEQLNRQRPHVEETDSQRETMIIYDNESSIIPRRRFKKMMKEIFN